MYVLVEEIEAPKKRRLIRSKTSAGAVNHCAKGRFRSTAVEGDALVKLLRDEGLPVEDIIAGED